MASTQNFRIDTHAHVISLERKMIPTRRHTPEEARLEDFLRFHDETGITHGVLVQPSVYGTDNGFMCEAIQTANGRLKGIAVVDPSFTDSALDQLADNRVVGVRFSCFDMPIATLGEPDWQKLIVRLAERGWIIEALIKSPDVPEFFKHVSHAGAPMVINHFGIPDKTLGVNDPSFQATLEEAKNGRVWVKVSGQYRCGGIDAAKPLADALMASLGPDRLLWGSDWPWTQFQDAGFTYKKSLDWLTDLVGDEAARAQILGTTAAQFYGFG